MNKCRKLSLLDSASSTKQEIDNEGERSTDKISQLPDEILASILSSLKLNEAVRTSVLARRWRNLWTRTASLDFECIDDKLLSWFKVDFYDECPIKLKDMSRSQRKRYLRLSELNRSWKLEKKGKLRLVMRPQFVEWVNKVLSLHEGFTIDKFEISCKLYGRIRSVFVDEWLKFALGKQVRRLKLDFGGRVSSSRGNYSLKKSLLCEYDKSLGCLRVLCLKKVDVTSKVLEYILLKCHLLEVLSVKDPYPLARLKIPGPLPQLKCLEMKTSNEMEYLKIGATNLKSFTYRGPAIPVSFEKVPCLVEAHIGGSYASFFAANMGQFSSDISRLVSLVLDLKHFPKFLEPDSLPKFPILDNLKQLELRLARVSVESIMRCCDSFLKSFPMLERLLLRKFPYCFKIWNEGGEYGVIREVANCVHRHNYLKVLEFLDFDGGEAVAFVACSLVSRLPSLERVILHPLCTPFEKRNTIIRGNITECAETLEKILPCDAVIILP